MILRQRVTEYPNAGGKQLVEVAGYKFQALRTNLPPLSAPWMSGAYSRRADIENSIKGPRAPVRLEEPALPNSTGPPRRPAT